MGRKFFNHLRLFPCQPLVPLLHQHPHNHQQLIEPKISEASAKNKLNGRTFTYYGLAGNPRDYRVEQKDLSNVAHKVVFVKKSSQGLEFRLAWKISVGRGLSWTVYVDAVTGEELKVVQMFRT